PILVFFYMVFEHSVVNMFLFPSGLMLHAPFSIWDYFIWNEIPTVLGNLVGGLSFTGLTLYATHVRTAPKRAAALKRVAVSILRSWSPNPKGLSLFSLVRRCEASSEYRSGSIPTKAARIPIRIFTA